MARAVADAITWCERMVREKRKLQPMEESPIPVKRPKIQTAALLLRKAR